MAIIGNIFLYITSLFAIWFGAGLIIKSIDKFAKRLRLSPFIISFVILGLLTSIPETAVSISSIVDKKPEIFVGTLLGGTMVIFLFIIPLLAILGNGIIINHNLDSKKLLILLGIIALPGLFAIDQRLTSLEGLALVAAYLFVINYIRKNQITESQQTNVMSLKIYSIMDLLKVTAGIGIVFVSSQIIVSQTVYFAEMINMPTFYLSLLILSLGTNLPELSIAISAIISGKKDVAFGNYLGSTTANALLFGVFTLINNSDVVIVDSFVITYFFIILGLGTFYYFSKSKKDISKKEGYVLLSIYLSFVIYEIIRGLIH